MPAAPVPAAGVGGQNAENTGRRGRGHVALH